MAYAGSIIFYTECSWISQEEQWKSCAKQNDVPRPGSGCLLVAWRCRPAWYGEAHGERLRVGNACACGWMRCGRGFSVCAWSRRWCSGVRAQALSGSDPSRVTSTWVGVTRRPGSTWVDLGRPGSTRGSCVCYVPTHVDFTLFRYFQYLLYCVPLSQNNLF